ncbi:ABC transporter permease [Sedimentibacter sp.]|uniref:ABC transporter permease n=1 Tax=Sedimentibacter sp. TaxID=1960295 RepID=UPI0028A72FC2|nr:ABC transporter permease [Sedimentibacter sp.]
MNYSNSYGKLFVSFKQYLIQITKDAMLFIVCLAPLMCGVLFKFGIPAAEKFLILEPYYLLFDLLLAVLTPMMISYVSAMIILGDIDEGITKYMAVTPLGRSGYLISKLGFPLSVSFFITIIVMMIFSLTKPSLVQMIGISISTSLLGFIMSMIVISISANKVEGMAVMKLSGIVIIGIPLAFLTAENVQYLFFFLPSLWIAKFSLKHSLIYFVVCIAVSSVWILFFVKKFLKKIY